MLLYKRSFRPYINWLNQRSDSTQHPETVVDLDEIRLLRVGNPRLFKLETEGERLKSTPPIRPGRSEEQKPKHKTELMTGDAGRKSAAL